MSGFEVDDGGGEENYITLDSALGAGAGNANKSKESKDKYSGGANSKNKIAQLKALQAKKGNNEPPRGGMQIYPGDLGTNEFLKFEEYASEGKRLQELNNFPEAILNYEKAISSGLAPYGLVGFVYGNVGRCYMALNSWNKALQ